MEKLTQKKLEIAQTYERNEQWARADAIYKTGLHDFFSDFRDALKLPRIPGLEGALDRVDNPIQPVEKGGALHKLWTLIREDEPGLEEHAAYAVSFFDEFVTDGAWAVCFLAGRADHQYGKALVTLPVAPSRLFLVRLGLESMLVKIVDPETKPMYAYLFAHWGFTQEKSIMPLYIVNRLFLESGKFVVARVINLYRFALSINPGYPWAMAHLGNVYRVMGNGWWGSPTDITVPDQRVEVYIKALIYFRETKPKNFWANAHTGAAIVNIRSFAPAPINDIPAIKKLFSDWVETGEIKVPERELEIAITNLAIDHLEKAQNSRGDFYPWAELYMGGAYLIKSFLDRSSDTEVTETAQLATAFILDGYILQPKLLLAVHEPDDLDNNPLISFAQLNLWTGSYDTAWLYTCLALSWNFTDAYMPGLNAIMLYQLLMNISYASINTNKKPVRLLKKPRRPHLGLNQPVPATPFESKEELAGFTLFVFEDTVRPVTIPFLAHEVKLTTKLEMGLQGILYAILNMIWVLTFCDSKHESLRKLACRITGKLKIHMPAIPNQENRQVLEELIFTFINTGTFGYAAKHFMLTADTEEAMHC